MNRYDELFDDYERESLKESWEVMNELFDYLDSNAPAFSKMMRKFLNKRIKNACQKYETDERSWEDEYNEWKF